MKISILLPYKENFSPDYPGAVSIYVKDTTLCSKYYKNIIIYGSTNYKNKLLKNYFNLPFKKKIFKSSSKIYVDSFLKQEKKRKSDIIEIHNRPIYVDQIKKKTNAKVILYFHNDPLEMTGSKTFKERINLFNNTEKIIFNSEWSKKRFILNLDKFFHKSEKLEVIYQSTNKVKIDIKKKKKIISFVGKLNKAKGYDIFGKAIIRILNKYSKWEGHVYGDEPRENLNFTHKNLFIKGFQSHHKVLNNFKYSSITVVCSRWNEPFGRTSLEASSRGCAVIITDRGGLPETVTDAIILPTLSVSNLYNSLEKLILNSKLRRKLQLKSKNNFYLTNKFVTKSIDKYRYSFFSEKNIFVKKNKLKVLHVTNFNERHNGRLFYNTGRRINNGLIRLNHSVLTFSDRDIVSYYRSIKDIDGSKKLNKKLISVISNYIPDIIILGHADLIKKDTLIFIKKNYPKIKIAQWFLDRMDSEWKSNRKRFLDKMSVVDASFCTTSPEILKFPKKNKVFYIPNPADESFETLSSYKNKNPKFDVFFAMSHGVHRGTLKKGKFDERERFIKKLMKKTPNIKYDLYGFNDTQPIWADDLKLKLYNSKMGLNLSQGKSIKYYSSDRITQLIGNGLLTLVDKKTQLNKFFKKNEVIFYDTINDLSKKILKYSENKDLRIKIAKKGKLKYHKYFNSKTVADFIINKTMNISNNKKYYWNNEK